MPTEVESEWLLGENILDAVRRTLPLRDVNLGLSRTNRLPNLYKLLRKVELREVFETTVAFLDYERAGEEEREVKLLSVDFEHGHDLLNLDLVLLENSNLPIDLVDLLPVLVVKVAVKCEGKDSALNLVLNSLRLQTCHYIDQCTLLIFARTHVVCAAGRPSALALNG